MRRFLAIALLLLLPLQFAFAAAASVCSTEGEGTPSHFGHHQHATNPLLPDDSGPSHGESDCGVCHLAGSQMSTTATIAVQLDESPADSLLRPAPPAEHLTQPFDRPPRALPA